MLPFLALLLLGEPSALERGHAHNDYEHERPLLDALDQGFVSVEADVFLVDGALLVGHNRKELKAERSLESLYLRPLAERERKSGGWIYRGRRRPFWLLVDVKSEEVSTYDALVHLLASRPRLKSVRFVISGNRAIDSIVRDKGRYGAIDGRWQNLGTTYSTDLMPWVSESWDAHFKWNGNGDMPATDFAELRSMSARAHAEKRKIRFWGTPDTEAVWKAEWDAGVDWINTDRLADFRAWTLQSRKGTS